MVGSLDDLILTATILEEGGTSETPSPDCLFLWPDSDSPRYSQYLNTPDYFYQLCRVQLSMCEAEGRDWLKAVSIVPPRVSEGTNADTVFMSVYAPAIGELANWKVTFSHDGLLLGVDYVSPSIDILGSIPITESPYFREDTTGINPYRFRR